MREIIKDDVFTSKDTTITLQPIPEQLLTVKDIASLLKCNIAAVHKLRQAGVIRFMKLGSYKCRVSTFLKFLEDYDGQDLSRYIHADEESECTNNEVLA